MKKQTISQQVAANAEMLKAFKTHSALRGWAIDNGMDNRSAFPKFKAALLEIGVDYNALRGGAQEQTQNELVSKITKTVTLFTDAKASAGRFGICDANGHVLWHGRFFDEDDAGEQSRAELCAAKKAVWLASKIKEESGQEAIELVLMTDAQWLTYQDHSGQKGYALTVMARKYSINLKVEWLPGTENPADQWTVASGFKKWSDNNLKALLTDVEIA